MVVGPLVRGAYGAWIAVGGIHLRAGGGALVMFFRLIAGAAKFNDFAISMVYCHCVKFSPGHIYT